MPQKNPDEVAGNVCSDVAKMYPVPVKLGGNGGGMGEMGGQGGGATGPWHLGMASVGELGAYDPFSHGRGRGGGGAIMPYWRFTVASLPNKSNNNNTEH